MATLEIIPSKQEEVKENRDSIKIAEEVEIKPEEILLIPDTVADAIESDYRIITIQRWKHRLKVLVQDVENNRMVRLIGKDDDWQVKGSIEPLPASLIERLKEEQGNYGL